MKVLDFGLAKALGPELSDLEAANSPTMTMTAAATKMGVIMGTAAYMSPEQARGKTVDKRADIWAFGIVLYEMLTGRQAFGGTDISLTLAAVLKTDLNLDALPDDTPLGLRRVLRRCIQKDRAQRSRDIGDVRLELDEALAAPVEEVFEAAAIAEPVSWQRPASIAAALVIAVIVGGMGAWSLTRQTSVPQRHGRFTLVTPQSAPVRLDGNTQDIAISPDGSRVVYVAQVAGGFESNRLYMRDLDQLEAFPLRGVEVGAGPFFSPDGNWIGYFDSLDRTLKKVLVEGGPPVTLATVSPLRGATWTTDDTIIYATNMVGGLWRVSAGGGEPELLTDPGEETHIWPEILPGGQALLFTSQATAATTDADRELAVLRMDTGEWTRLGVRGSYPKYASTGHIVYGVDGTLRAVPFSLERLAVLGDPIPVLEGVRTKFAGVANFAISLEGALAYVAGGEAGSGSPRRLVWVDREGNEEPLETEARAYDRPRISPDGTKVALELVEDERDIWVWDFARETLTRLTFDRLPDLRPIWTPDGERVVFASDREGPRNLFWRPADGTGTVERLSESPNAQLPNDFSPDGTVLVYREDSPGNLQDLYLLSLDDDSSAEVLIASEFAERDAELSPDGNWIAYESTASGVQQVIVQPFPNVDDGLWQVSTDSGQDPRWSADGRELFYRLSGGAVMAVTVESESGFLPGNPELLFEGQYRIGQSGAYDVSPDGQRFLMMREGTRADGASQAQLVYVLNWFTELQARVPTGR